MRFSNSTLIIVTALAMCACTKPKPAFSIAAERSRVTRIVASETSYANLESELVAYGFSNQPLSSEQLLRIMKKDPLWAKKTGLDNAVKNIRSCKATLFKKYYERETLTYPIILGHIAIIVVYQDDEVLHYSFFSE